MTFKNARSRSTDQQHLNLRGGNNRESVIIQTFGHLD